MSCNKNIAFRSSLKVNTELYDLKRSIESGKVKISQLNNNQIEELNKLYDDEIITKLKSLEKLRKQ